MADRIRRLVIEGNTMGEIPIPEAKTPPVFHAATVPDRGVVAV